jgi:hypothetical protein
MVAASPASHAHEKSWKHEFLPFTNKNNQMYEKTQTSSTGISIPYEGNIHSHIAHLFLHHDGLCCG